MDDIRYEPIEEREAPDRVEIHVGDVVRVILNEPQVRVVE